MLKIIVITCDTSDSSPELPTSVTNKVSTQTEANKVHLVEGSSGDRVHESQELSKTTAYSGDSISGRNVVGNGESSPVQNDDVDVILSEIRCKNARQGLHNKTTSDGILYP